MEPKETVTTVTDVENRPSMGYVMRLPDGKSVYLELPDEYVSRDRGGQLLLKPPAIRHMDEVRAIAMRAIAQPSPAYLMTLREALGFTQQEFGKAIGVDKMTISRWERGERRPGVESLQKIEAVRNEHVRQGVLLHHV